MVGLAVRRTSYSVVHAILRSFAPARLGWLCTLSRSARIISYSRLGGFTRWVERSDNRYASSLFGCPVNDTKSVNCHALQTEGSIRCGKQFALSDFLRTQRLSHNFQVTKLKSKIQSASPSTTCSSPRSSSPSLCRPQLSWQPLPFPLRTLQLMPRFRKE